MDASVPGVVDEPLARLHRENAIPRPHLDNEAVVVGFREFMTTETIAQLSEPKAVEVADKLVHELRPRGCRRPHTVEQQLLENDRAVREHE